MAIFKDSFFEKTGTEIEFVQGLIDLICGLNDSITCEDTEGNPTTAAEQYADLTSASRATFILNFGNGIWLRLQRRYTNDRGDCVYSIQNNILNAAVTFMGNDTAVMANAVRRWRIAYLNADDLLLLWFGRHEASSIAYANCSFGVFSDTNARRFYGTVNSNNILSAAFYSNDTTGSFTYASMFPYSAGAGKIDFAEQSTFVSGTTKQFSTEAIKSCSTMPQWASIALPDGRNFFTISANAMVEVEEEE